MAKQIKCNIDNVFVDDKNHLCLALSNTNKDSINQNFEISIHKYLTSTNLLISDINNDTLSLIKSCMDVPIYLKKKRDLNSNLYYVLTTNSKKDIIGSLNSIIRECEES